MRQEGKEKVCPAQFRS